VTVSVIVSTYQRPDYLALVLLGYATQTDRDFELVVADDGSGPETRAVIAAAAATHRLDILHVWHEDRGFRKTEILNRAIVAASGEYLLFTDGDCIPRADLVATHRSLATEDRYIAGGYLKLPPHVSAAVDPAAVESGRVAELRWLRSAGWRPGRRSLRLTGSDFLGALFDRLTPTRADFHGNNASVARGPLEAVNGFEGEMGYGGLDKAVGYRLENLGVKGVQARHRAVALHLHHDRPYRDPAVMDRNREILARIRAGGEVRARMGITELGSDPTLRIERHGTREHG
jgi:glycosyltransferase involved in cell wall biosynthesis